MEQQREARGLPALDVLRQDLRFAVRTLWRDRTLAAVVVLVLALGIGANVAVFSVVNTILLRPLPFHDASALVWLAGNEGKGGLSEQTYTVAAYEEFRRHNRSFEDVTSYQTFFNSIQYKMVGRGEPVPLTGVQVAENFFPLLGVEPVLGRLFTPDECRKGGPRRGTAELPVLAAAVRGKSGDCRADHYDPCHARRYCGTGHDHRRSSRVVRLRRSLLARDEGGLLCTGVYGFLADVGQYAGGARAVEARGFGGTGAGGGQYPVPAAEGGEQGLVLGLQVHADGAAGAREREAPAVPNGALVRGGTDSADRLHQCLKPPACTRDVTREGVCDADGAGRNPREADPAVADGEPSAIGCRNSARAGAGMGNYVIPRTPDADRAAAARDGADRYGGAGLDGRDCDRGWRAVRASRRRSGWRTGTCRSW